jgi:hypothetical protein
MSARAVHVRIGRLVVDAQLRGDVAQWVEAIEGALRVELMRGPGAGRPAVSAEAHVAEAIAQRVGDTAPATHRPSSGGRGAGG